jgi:hypothetical protein
MVMGDVVDPHGAGAAFSVKSKNATRAAPRDGDGAGVATVAAGFGFFWVENMPKRPAPHPGVLAVALLLSEGRGAAEGVQVGGAALLDGGVNGMVNSTNGTKRNSTQLTEQENATVTVRCS